MNQIINKDNVTLCQFKPAWGLPNVNPFCMKLETFCRMFDIKYENSYLDSPSSSPKGKLPYIKYKDKKISDSSFAIEFLIKTKNLKIDNHLSDIEKSVSLAYTKLLEEHFYWCGVYSRWIDDDYWPITKKLWFGGIPFPLNLVISKKVKDNMKKAIYGHGLGRHTKEEIYKLAEQDIKSIVDYLGKKEYFLGERPSSIDCVVYSFISNTINVPLDTPIKKYALKFNSLEKYCERMKKNYFPELSA